MVILPLCELKIFSGKVIKVHIKLQLRSKLFFLNYNYISNFIQMENEHIIISNL